MKLPLKTFRLRNFKAVRDSERIRFSPLTVLIGNNGSGKSSLIEGLETMHDLVVDGIDGAFARWHGSEYAWNLVAENPSALSKLMAFDMEGRGKNLPFLSSVQLETDSFYNTIRVREYRAGGKKTAVKDASSYVISTGIRDVRFDEFVSEWQFLSMNPAAMTESTVLKRTRGRIALRRDGANVAEVLEDIRLNFPIEHFNGIIDAMKAVLPFARDIYPIITSETERRIYLCMKEFGLAGPVPSWMLSTGTVRILALLTMLRHPSPPRLLVIEEIENGLDPRTISMLVEEIRLFVEDGRGQIIATTHSPYLLDLLPLSTIVTCERDEKGSPIFRRPASDKALREWAKKFSPGKLYTMGAFRKAES